MARPVGGLLAGLLLATLFAAAALAGGDVPAPRTGPPLAPHPTNFYSAPLPLARLAPQNVAIDNSRPLKPGVNVTRPYTIVLLVPQRGIDANCVVPANVSRPRMPVLKPGLRAVPQTHFK